MKVSKILNIVLAGALAVVAIVAAIPVQNSAEQVDAPGVVMDVLDPSLNGYAPAWQKEIARRFPNAVGVLCHGGDLVAGQWIDTAKSYEHYTTIDSVVKHERELHPDKVIVLLACNTGHIRLHGDAHVFYAMDSVWCVPDRSVGDFTGSDDHLKTQYVDEPDGDGGQVKPSPKSRWSDDPNAVGNIFEFVQAN